MAEFNLIKGIPTTEAEVNKLFKFLIDYSASSPQKINGPLEKLGFDPSDGAPELAKTFYFHHNAEKKVRAFFNSEGKFITPSDSSFVENFLNKELALQNFLNEYYLPVIEKKVKQYITQMWRNTQFTEKLPAAAFLVASDKLIRQNAIKSVLNETFYINGAPKYYKKLESLRTSDSFDKQKFEAELVEDIADSFCNVVVEEAKKGGKVPGYIVELGKNALVESKPSSGVKDGNAANRSSANSKPASSGAKIIPMATPHPNRSSPDPNPDVNAPSNKKINLGEKAADFMAGTSPTPDPSRNVVVVDFEFFKETQDVAYENMYKTGNKNGTATDVNVVVYNKKGDKEIRRLNSGKNSFIKSLDVTDAGKIVFKVKKFQEVIYNPLEGWSYPSEMMGRYNIFELEYKADPNAAAVEADPQLAVNPATPAKGKPLATPAEGKPLVLMDSRDPPTVPLVLASSANPLPAPPALTPSSGSNPVSGARNLGVGGECAFSIKVAGSNSANTRLNIELAPARASFFERQGQRVPGAGAGLEIRSKANIAKLNVPGSRPIYQHMGIAEECINFVGAFVGFDHWLVNEKGNSVREDGQGNTLRKYNAWEESTMLNKLFAKGQELELELRWSTPNIPKTADSSKGNHELKFEYGEGKAVAFRGYIKEMQRAYATAQRVYYHVSFCVTNREDVESQSVAQGKPITLPNDIVTISALSTPADTSKASANPSQNNNAPATPEEQKAAAEAENRQERLLPTVLKADLDHPFLVAYKSASSFDNDKAVKALIEKNPKYAETLLELLGIEKLSSTKTEFLRNEINVIRKKVRSFGRILDINLEAIQKQNLENFDLRAEQTFKDTYTFKICEVSGYGLSTEIPDLLTVLHSSNEYETTKTFARGLNDFYRRIVEKGTVKIINYPEENIQQFVLRLEENKLFGRVFDLRN